MSDREKLLAGIVGSLMVMMTAYYVWSSASEAVSTRRARLVQLQQDNELQLRTVEAASQATAELQRLNQYSLPRDREAANSTYAEWLLALVDQVGFQNPSVKAADRRFRNEYFERLRFNVEADAKLGQLIEFLESFYRAGDLHGIESISIRPEQDTRTLAVIITIEAISLPLSDRTTVGDVASTAFDSAAAAAARASIAQRAMFFPANVPPQLTPIVDQEIAVLRPWSFAARASDADPSDSLIFAFRGDVPSGLELDQTSPDTASLSWTPKELGEHTVQLAVVDDGSPQREATREFKIKVVEATAEPAAPPPRVTGFDHAKQAILIAVVSDGDALQAWIAVRTQSKVLRLSVGDEVRVGSVVGDITAIARRHVEINTDNGPLKIAIGQPLLAM